jgi:hypothetical protein
VPFVPVIVLSLLAVTPEPAVALPSSGGQNDRQLPVHVDLEEVSDANMYSVFPEPSVRYVPSGPDRVATVIDDVPPLAAFVPPPAAGVVPLPEPPELEHAERTRPAASAAPTVQLRALATNTRVTIALIPFEPHRTSVAGVVPLVTSPMPGRFTLT